MLEVGARDIIDSLYIGLITPAIFIVQVFLHIRYSDHILFWFTLILISENADIRLDY